MPPGRQRLFAIYYKPLAVADQNRVLRAAEQDGMVETGHAIFNHACAVVDQDETARRKVDFSRQLAGLWRNLCLGLLIVAAILISGMVWHSVASSWSKADSRKLGYATLALVEAAAMLYRYLKFSRRHALDVLTGYAAVGR